MFPSRGPLSVLAHRIVDIPTKSRGSQSVGDKQGQGFALDPPGAKPLNLIF